MSAALNNNIDNSITLGNFLSHKASEDSNIGKTWNGDYNYKTLGEDICVLAIPTGFPDCISKVSSGFRFLRDFNIE